LITFATCRKGQRAKGEGGRAEGGLGSALGHLHDTFGTWGKGGLRDYRTTDSGTLVLEAGREETGTTRGSRAVFGGSPRQPIAVWWTRCSRAPRRLKCCPASATTRSHTPCELPCADGPFREDGRSGAESVRLSRQSGCLAGCASVLAPKGSSSSPGAIVVVGWGTA
jgi:hypothetical protein